MNIIKIPRETGSYQDAEGNQFDLIEVMPGDTYATVKEIITMYDSLEDYLIGESTYKVENINE